MGRFTKTTYDGKTVDKKTLHFIKEMEARLGYNLTITQGSYNTGVGASAGTHSGGGALDLAAYDWKNKVKVAADLGAAAWYRPYIPGLWGAHVHLIIRKHGNLPSVAQRQVQDWDARPPRNGLASHAPMDLSWEYHPMKEIKFWYRPKRLKNLLNPKPKKQGKIEVPKPTRVSKARDGLVEAIHDLGNVHAMLAATPRAKDETSQVAKVIKMIERERADLKDALNKLPKR